MHAWMHGCMDACMHVCMYACMHACMHIYLLHYRGSCFVCVFFASMIYWFMCVECLYLLPLQEHMPWTTLPNRKKHEIWVEFQAPTRHWETKETHFRRSQQKVLLTNISWKRCIFGKAYQLDHHFQSCNFIYIIFNLHPNYEMSFY